MPGYLLSSNLLASVPREADRGGRLPHEKFTFSERTSFRGRLQPQYSSSSQEEHRVAHIGGFRARRDGQVGLAHPGRSDDPDVAPPLELKNPEALFRHHVIRMLIAKGKFNPEMLALQNGCRHISNSYYGFSVTSSGETLEMDTLTGTLDVFLDPAHSLRVESRYKSPFNPNLHFNK